MGLSLNLGCGSKHLESISNHICVNVDIRLLDGVNVVCDVKHLPFKNKSFERILASDIIEHFPISETDDLLVEWARVLKFNGHIKIRTPSLRWMLSHYSQENDAKFVSYHIFGGQDYPGNFHYVIFDRKWLSSLCEAHGLKTIGYREINSNFEIIAAKE